MSLHPSLRVDSAGVQQRSVLTRIERIKDLMKRGLWEEKKSSVGLPKLKIVKIKAKKTKAADEAAAGETAAAGATDAKGPAGGKPAAAGKAAATAPAGKADAKKEVKSAAAKPAGKPAGKA